MKKTFKKFYSSLLIIAFVISSIFVNSESVNAAKFYSRTDGEELTSSDGVDTSIINGEKVLTLSKDVNASDRDIEVLLNNNETATLDGNGHTLSAKHFFVRGKGTLIIKDITINADSSAIITEGTMINLIFRGSKPTVLRTNEIPTTNPSYTSPMLICTPTTVVVEDNADVKIIGQNKFGPGEYSGLGTVITNVSKLFITKGTNSKFEIVNARKYNSDVNVPERIGYQISDNNSDTGKVSYYPSEIFISNPTNAFPKYIPVYKFNIALIAGKNVIRNDEYTSLGTSVEANLLPTYFGSNYQLEGYYADVACTVPLGESFDYSGANKTIYAKCNMLLSDVSFETNGGSSVSSQQISINEKVTKPATPTKTGYTFAGWYKDSTLSQEYDFNTAVTNDFKLYAKWTKIVSTTTKEETSKDKTPVKKKFLVRKSFVQSNSRKLSKKLNVSFGGKKLTISWNPIKGVTGYKIYATKRGQKFKYIKTVKGSQKDKTTICKINGKELSENSTYKVYVEAYKTVNGKNYIYGNSLVANCVGTKNSKYTNASSIICNKKSKSMKLNSTYKMKVKVTKQDSDKTFLPKDLCRRLRYFSSNITIATVSSTGEIKAIGTGKCAIYAVAMNGKSTKMTIKVKATK